MVFVLLLAPPPGLDDNRRTDPTAT